MQLKIIILNKSSQPQTNVCFLLFMLSRFYIIHKTMYMDVKVGVKQSRVTKGTKEKRKRRE